MGYVDILESVSLFVSNICFVVEMLRSCCCLLHCTAHRKIMCEKGMVVRKTKNYGCLLKVLKL